jgi:hypothetical protein
VGAAVGAGLGAGDLEGGTGEAETEGEGGASVGDGVALEHPARMTKRDSNMTGSFFITQASESPKRKCDYVDHSTCKLRKKQERIILYGLNAARAGL